MTEPRPRLPEVLSAVSDGRTATLDLAVHADLLWFDGHFPDLPVLPGVVQIDWAMHFARRYVGLEAVSAPAFRVKFKAPIRPGDRLTLALARLAMGSELTFEYHQAGRVFTIGRTHADNTRSCPEVRP